MGFCLPQSARHSPENLHETMSGFKTARLKPRTSLFAKRKGKSYLMAALSKIIFPLSAGRNFSHRE